MIVNYLLSENYANNETIAVIKDIDTDRLNENFYPELINKVGLAIENHFSYEERVKAIHDEVTLKSVFLPYEFNNSIFTIAFKCTDEDGDEEIREMVLEQIAIY